MILDIDAGNTRIKWRVLDQAGVIARGDQLTESVRQGTPLEITDADNIQRIRLCSVAGSDIIEALHSQLKGQFDCPLALAEVNDSAAGVLCGYKDYLQLGVDRWLAVIAAYKNVANSLIVVDAGSAVTIDIVDAEGAHQGGYIVPGLRLMHQALWQGTEHIKVEAKPVANIVSPGRSTDDAVDKGCLLLLVSTIEALVDQHNGKLVITGGDGLILRDQLRVAAEYCPDLVLEGLAVEGVGFRVLEK
ncbi:MAG: type III pantothenate kinase [Porticoccaceae bacterium]|nr:type III pantothenate kinase [Porticoccaceae bacterium]